jgi:hypothetical protein
MHGNTSTPTNMITPCLIDKTNQGLPKDIRRIVAQRIQAYEVAAAEMDAETR